MLHLLSPFAAAALAACNVPTDLPSIDTQWAFPAEETSVGIGDFLPAEVSLTADSSAFLVNFDPIAFSTSLGALCPACVAVNGLTVPKPPFLGSFEDLVDFPTEVSAISILSGDVVFEIENQLNFDPLRPTSGSFGQLTITITDDADAQVLGTLVVDGAATPFPGGTTLTRTLALDTATVTGNLVATVEVNSPVGDPVTIDTSDLVRATVTPMNILVASATIDVAGEDLDLDPRDLDVEDIDEDLEDHILSGAFTLDVVNPFGVGADFQLTISGPGFAPVQKSLSIGTAPTSKVTVDFTLEELTRVLGEPNVTLSGSGTVDPSAGPITVLPGDELVLDGRFDVTLRIGYTGND